MNATEFKSINADVKTDPHMLEPNVKLMVAKDAKVVTQSSSILRKHPGMNAES